MKIPISASMLGGPTQNMWNFHTPYYPPKFFQPSGTTPNIISLMFQQKHLVEPCRFDAQSWKSCTHIST